VRARQASMAASKALWSPLARKARRATARSSSGSAMAKMIARSVQTAPDGSRRIVWMIIGMIKAHPTDNRMARQAGPEDSRCVLRPLP
jgi:hypothetical protein